MIPLFCLGIMIMLGLFVLDVTRNVFYGIHEDFERGGVLGMKRVQ